MKFMYTAEQQIKATQIHISANVLNTNLVCNLHDIYFWSWDSSVIQCWAMDDWRFKSWQGLGIFLFTTMSRLALEPIQPPIQWVPGVLSLGVKQLRCEANHSPPPSAEVKECVELYLYSPNTPSWHSSQLKKHRDNFTLTP
jgi:hypothetical protein